MVNIVRYWLRRNTSTYWADKNPILHDGEIAHSTDTGGFKIGDGITPWSDIPELTGPQGPPGSGVSDGNKGDIVVSGNGASWVLDTDIIAYLLARGNHTGQQTASTISDLSEAIDDRVGALVANGTGISAVYDDGTGTLTISTSALLPTAGGFLAPAAMNPLMPIIVRKDLTTGFWPTSYSADGTPSYTGGANNTGLRPTSRSDICVIWAGAAPQPPIVSSGTAGMRDNIDRIWIDG